MRKWKWIGVCPSAVARIAVLALTLAVLGPAIAQSQILIIVLAR